ncbi:MAG TPA: hypothetical protein VMR34_04230 [Candidatus Saccharimonadales bacterium]|nr:hypothetical protein [Candidatus Saccharimonadales bacterium]
MKQKDILTIIAVVVISAIFSTVIAGKIIAPPKNRSKQIDVVSPISSAFSTPSSKYFNSQSIDPTQLIQIGTGGNQPSPFGTGN